MPPLDAPREQGVAFGRKNVIEQIEDDPLLVFGNIVVDRHVPVIVHGAQDALDAVPARHDGHAAHDVGHGLGICDFAEEPFHRVHDARAHGRRAVADHYARLAVDEVVFCRIEGRGRVIVGIDEAAVIHIRHEHDGIVHVVRNIFGDPSAVSVRRPALVEGVEHVQHGIPPEHALILAEAVSVCIFLSVPVRIPFREPFEQVIEVEIVEIGIFGIFERTAAGRRPVFVDECLIPVAAVEHGDLRRQGARFGIVMHDDGITVQFPFQETFDFLLRSQRREGIFQVRIIVQVGFIIHQIRRVDPVGIGGLVFEMDKHVGHVAAADQLVEQRGRVRDRCRFDLEIDVEFIFDDLKNIRRILARADQRVHVVAVHVDDQPAVFVVFVRDLERLLARARADPEQHCAGQKQHQKSFHLFPPDFNL